jgi:hypothetical protein
LFRANPRFRFGCTPATGPVRDEASENPMPDRKLETGAAGTGQAGGARDPKKPDPGTTTQGEPDGDRDAIEIDSEHDGS